MKKFGLALVILFLIGVAVFTWMVAFSGESVRDLSNIPGNVPPDIKSLALNVALSDPDVKNAIQGQYEVLAIEYVDPKNMGYIGYNGSLVHVLIQTHPILESLSYDVLVDPVNKKEMGVNYLGSPTLAMGLHNWRIVPPGVFWADHLINISMSLSREVSVQGIRAGVEFEPRDATVYAMILDQDNFTKLENGLPFDAPVLINSTDNTSIKVDGSQPISSGWKPQLSMPPAKLKYPGFDNGDYLVSHELVVRNGETSEDVKVTSTGFP